MKKAILWMLLPFLINCYSSAPTVSRSPSLPSDNNKSLKDYEDEYNELTKTYKPETEKVLNYLLNDENASNNETSAIFENTSPCNMVLTISGNYEQKKIPIAAGKIGYTLLKKGTYRISGVICRSILDMEIHVEKPYRVKLSNQ